MKKLLLLIVALATSATIFAQNYKEVVHLKNGSVIKGVIIEQVPNESLKIQTADGSLFVYKMSEVAKITKEEVSAPAQTASSTTPKPSKELEPSGNEKLDKFLTKKYITIEKEPKQPKEKDYAQSEPAPKAKSPASSSSIETDIRKGWRGFFELGGGYTSSTVNTTTTTGKNTNESSSSSNAWCPISYITYGKQLGETFFAGLGSGVILGIAHNEIQGNTDINANIPIFTDLRCEIPSSEEKSNLFAELRTGVEISTSAGKASFYISPALGYRVSHWNFALRYEHTSFTGDKVTSGGNRYQAKSESQSTTNNSTILLTIGLDWGARKK